MGKTAKKSVFWPEEIGMWNPPEALTVSQCADKYRVLPIASAKPGRWETGFLPFLGDIMDSFGIDCIEEIYTVMPAQSGKTESSVLNMLLYAILQDPGPAMIVEPTEALAVELSTDRVDRMIASCDALVEVQSQNEDETTKKKKVFQSMTVYFSWAGSPASLASRPIRYLFFDEADKYPKFSGEEASPVSLAKERTNTFVMTRKIIYASTPTVESNYISQGEQSCIARFRYHVPCPQCGERQILNFENVVFDVVKPEAEDSWTDYLDDVEEKAYYRCEKCQSAIHNDQRSEMVRRGKWIDIYSGLDFEACIKKIHPRSVGFQINRLYTPWHTFGMVAREFLKSKDDPAMLMNWKNSWMAEPWVERAESKSVQQLVVNKIDLSSLICPNGTLALTAGVDPGQGGFWFVVLAWDRQMSPHLVHYGFLIGWDSLRTLLWENVYPIDGTEDQTHIWRAGIDTGGSKYESEGSTMTEAAYNWLRQYGQQRVYGIKGGAISGGKRVKASKIDQMPGANGRIIPGGLVIWIVDTNSFKDSLHYRLQVQEGNPGRLTFNRDTGEDLFRHLSAEEKRRKRDGSYEWVKVGKHNHLLDATLIAMSMADPECLGGVRVLNINQQRRGRRLISQGV